MLQRVASALAALALFAATPLFAQPYPSKPVRIIVPYAPGGPYDEVARVISQRLTEMWGQTVIVESRAGAGGNIGADFVAKSPPDGYTLLLGNAGPITINPSLYRKLPYDPQRDLAPVTQLIAASMTLVVHPSLPAKNVKDLIALARAKPGAVNYASAGVGNLQHLTMELLQSLTKTRMNHVPYKGAAPAFVDLIGGQVEVMFANIVGAMQHVKSGRVRAIAVSSAKRAAMLPDVPALAETVPEIDVTTWSGLFVAAGTPREIVTKVNGDVGRVLERPDIRDRFASQGASTVPGPPEALAQLVRREAVLYAKVIKSAGIQQE